jgi:hypothetical protein
MASQYKEKNRLAVAATEKDALENDPRACLTSDVDALLAIFERIEQSVADGSPAGKLNVIRKTSRFLVVAEHKKSQGTLG